MAVNLRKPQFQLPLWDLWDNRHQNVRCNVQDWPPSLCKIRPNPFSIFGDVLTRQTDRHVHTQTANLISHHCRVKGRGGKSWLNPDGCRVEGRSGNSWLSPDGCAMFSVHVRISTSSFLGQRVSFIQHLMSLAVVLAVRQKPHCDVRCFCHFTTTVNCCVFCSAVTCCVSIVYTRMSCRRICWLSLMLVEYDMWYKCLFWAVCN